MNGLHIVHAASTLSLLLAVPVALSSPDEPPEPDASAADLLYRLSPEGTTFIPGEPIVVRMSLTNVGDRAVAAREPALGTSTAEMILYVMDEDGRHSVGGSEQGEAPSTWPVRVVDLSPGQTLTTRVSVADFAAGSGTFLLPPGRYELTSRYFLIDPFASEAALARFAEHAQRLDPSSADYRANVLEADPVTFGVRARTPAEEREWQGYRRDFTVLVTTLDAEGEGGPSADPALRAFLKKYEGTPYRAVSINRLDWELTGRKDWRRLVELYGILRREHRDRQGLEGILIAEASALENLNEPAEAIRVMGLSDHPAAQWHREVLLLRYPDIAPPPADPPPDEPDPPAAPDKPAAAPPPEGRFGWTVGLGLVLPVLAAVVAVWYVRKRPRA